MSLENPEFIKSPVGIQVAKLIETHKSLKENAAKLEEANTTVKTKNEAITRLNLELDELNIKATALNARNDSLEALDKISDHYVAKKTKNTAELTANDHEKAPIGVAINDREAEIAKANAEIATLNTNSNTALGELETAVKNLATHMTAIKTATSTLNNILHKADNTARIAELDTVIAAANAKLDAVDTGLKAQLAKAENDKVEVNNQIAALPNNEDDAVASILSSWETECETLELEIAALRKKAKAKDANAKQAELNRRSEEVENEADLGREQYNANKAALENASEAFDEPIAALKKEITDTELSVTTADAEKSALSAAGGDLNDAIDHFKNEVAKYHDGDIDKIVTPRFVELLDGTAVAVVPKGPEVSEDIQDAFDIAEEAVENTKKVIETTDTNLQTKILERDAKAEALEQAQKEYNTYLSSADGAENQKAVDDYELVKDTNPTTRGEKATKAQKKSASKAAKKVMSDKKEPVDKAQEELEILEPQVQATTKDLDDLKGQLPDLETKLTNTKTALEAEQAKVAAEKVVFDAKPPVDPALLEQEKAEAVKVMDNFAKLLSFDATEKFAGEDLSVAENAENAENAVLGEAIAVFEFDFGSHA
jgi:chromosome segregation ATPase